MMTTVKDTQDLDTRDQDQDESECFCQICLPQIVDEDTEPYPVIYISE